MSLGITDQDVEAQRKALNEIRRLLGKPEEPPYESQKPQNTEHHHHFSFAHPFASLFSHRSKSNKTYSSGSSHQQDIGQ